MKITLIHHHHHHPPPPTQTQCQQYLSCYWPDINQTLKIGSWDEQQQQQLQQQKQTNNNKNNNNSKHNHNNNNKTTFLGCDTLEISLAFVFYDHEQFHDSIWQLQSYKDYYCHNKEDKLKNAEDFRN